METRPLTGDLLALDNEMNIYSLKLCKSNRNTLTALLELLYGVCVCVIGHVERKHCFQLSDPVGRFQTSPLLHNQPITGRLQLFSYHNNIGVLYKGCLRFSNMYKNTSHILTMLVVFRLYSGSCGELIFSSDEFEGSNVGTWYGSSAIERFGMWTQQGIWIVRVSFTCCISDAKIKISIRVF